MSDVQFSARMRKADRRSKVIALFVAMGVFVGSIWLTGAPQMSSITAAGAGIGARFVIPYRVSLTVPEKERTPIEEHPGTGNYHHGAVGAALLLGSLLTVGALVTSEDTFVSLWVGFLATGLLYLLFSELLPRG